MTMKTTRKKRRKSVRFLLPSRNKSRGWRTMVSFFLFVVVFIKANVFKAKNVFATSLARESPLLKSLLLEIPPISPLNPAKEFSRDEAVRFRRLSGAAYCERGLGNWTCEFCDQPRELKDVTVFESEKRFVKGFVGFDGERKRAVLSFRGTEPKSFENWLENLDATHAGFQLQILKVKGEFIPGF